MCYSYSYIMLCRARVRSLLEIFGKKVYILRASMTHKIHATHQTLRFNKSRNSAAFHLVARIVSAHARFDFILFIVRFFEADLIKEDDRHEDRNSRHTFFVCVCIMFISLMLPLGKIKTTYHSYSMFLLSMDYLSVA